MSFDDSDHDDEWEVVDIVQTTTSVNPNKPKPVKKEDVDKLAQELDSKLSVRSYQLEEKLRRQERLNQQQLADIQSKLSAIARVQSQQERQQHDLDTQRQQLEAQQKQALLEQQIKIESLSELTQKQIAEAQHKIDRTQLATQHVSENVQNLHQLQQLQDQNLQAQQLQTQQHLTQLAQLQQLQTQNNNMMHHQIPPPNVFNTVNPSQNVSNVSSPPFQFNDSSLNNGSSNVSTNSNTWLPSFFFGNNSNKNADLKPLDNQSNISTTITTSFESQTTHPNPVLNNLHHNLNDMPDLESLDEKAVLDDETVLGWNNEYGLLSDPSLLKTKGVIGEGKFRPNEHRQCGWILQNKSRNIMKLSASLECISGDNAHGVRITAEKQYEFELKPDEEVFILVEVIAPGITGKYCAWYRLVMDNGQKLGDTLEITCEVEAQFSKQKEEKIANLIKMGFERKKVVSVLQKKNWNVQKSANALISM